MAQEEWDSPDPNADLKIIADRIETLNTRYWRIENIPVWPLHLTTLKRFQRNYILLTTPLITRLVNDNTKVGELVAEILRALSLEGV
jgi:hypothetical protein